MKLFHITNDRWGAKKLVEPRVPKSNGFNEPRIPRICVCPSIEQCLWIIGECAATAPHVAIYYTDTDLYVEPYDVHDSHHSGEKWLLEPTEFRLLKVLTTREKRSLPWWDEELLYLAPSNIEELRKFVLTYVQVPVSV